MQAPPLPEPGRDSRSGRLPCRRDPLCTAHGWYGRRHRGDIRTARGIHRHSDTGRGKRKSTCTCAVGPNRGKARAKLARPEVGLDLGVARLATLSDGTVIKNPKALSWFYRAAVIGELPPGREDQIFG